MINRRHIRLKVMQSLYAYFTSNNKDFTLAQKQMLKQCDSIAHLHLLLLSLPLALAQFSKDFLVQQKQKHFPTNESLSGYDCCHIAVRKFTESYYKNNQDT